MRDIFPNTSEFMEVLQSAGNEQVDLSDVGKYIRMDGRECGWNSGDENEPPEKRVARMMFAQFLAGMFDEPLANSPRYTTAQLEFPDMEISISASRPGGTTPLNEHERIRHMCTRAGWNPAYMSLSEFVGKLIHAERHG